MLDLSIFQQPPLRGRHRRRLHQRALALRPDVHLRLLLPGRPGRRPDHWPGSSWRRWRSGCWSPRPWPGSGPTATAPARWRRWGCWSPPLGLALMTTLQADSAYWQGMLWLALVGIGSGMFISPNTAAMMGTVPTERRGDRRRRPDDAAEHRRRDLDRLRPRDRHRGGAEAGPLQDLLRPRLRPQQRPARPVHRTTCTRRCGCWRRPRCVGAGVSLLRPRDESAPSREGSRLAGDEAIREEIEATP